MVVSAAEVCWQVSRHAVTAKIAAVVHHKVDVPGTAPLL